MLRGVGPEWGRRGSPRAEPLAKLSYRLQDPCGYVFGQMLDYLYVTNWARNRATDIKRGERVKAGQVYIYIYIYIYHIYIYIYISIYSGTPAGKSQII